MRRPLLVIALAALLAGCGEQRTPPPDVRHPDPPSVPREFELAGAGVTFTGPDNWDRVPARPPLEGGLTNRTAIVAVWRYPRVEPLPEGDAQLERARERLIERVRARNETFDVRSSRLTEAGGAPGIELVGSQVIRGVDYDVRSAHFFVNGAEVVVDAYAFPEDFASVDETVFVPLIKSLSFVAP